MKISVEGLYQGYDDTNVLENISFEANSGEILALLGPNGSGKSTLIKSLCDLITPESGKIMINDTDLSEYDITDLAKIISYVPQSTDTGVYTSVIDTVLLGRRPYVSWSYREKDI